MMKRPLLFAVLLVLAAFVAAYTQGIKTRSGTATSIDAGDIVGTIDIGDQTDFAIASNGLASYDGETVNFNDLFYAAPCDIGNPVTGHSDLCQQKFAYNFTITEIACSTDVATSTVDIEFEERVRTTPDTAGTEVMGADLQCDTNEATDTTFSNAEIAADALLSLKITAVANAPTKLRVYVKGRYTP
jgi:hypothetical protein